VRRKADTDGEDWTVHRKKRETDEVRLSGLAHMYVSLIHCAMLKSLAYVDGRCLVSLNRTGSGYALTDTVAYRPAPSYLKAARLPCQPQ
jgi:hypothetical protein